MAAGVTIKHKRKAGAFAGGNLAAGEIGIDTTNDDLYFSGDGSTVKSLSPADILDLQLRVARQEMLRQIDEDVALGKYVWGYNYSTTDGINAGSSSNYTHVPASNLVTNQDTNSDTFTISTNLNYANRCEINAFSGLTASGTSVRVKFQASASGARDIDAAYIGTKATSGNAWDVQSDNTQLLFGGSGTYSLSASEEVWSDWADFDLTHTDDILVAVDVGGNGNSDYGTEADVTLYHKSATDNAADQVRESGYTTNSTRCKGITAIEVRTGAQSMSLVSTAYSAGVEPNTLQIFAEYNSPDEDVTLATDLEYYVSIDGGTTWAEVDFSSGASYTSGANNLVSGTVDVSAQTGTSWVMKIETPGGTPKLAEILWWVGIQLT